MHNYFLSVLVAALAVLSIGASPQPAQPLNQQPPVETKHPENKSAPTVESSAKERHAAEESSPAVAYRRLCDAKERAILSALNETTSVSIDDMPLRDALELLENKWNVPLMVDRKTLAAAGIQMDERVTVQAEKLTRRAVLDLLLAPVKLDWTVRHEVLWISTHEDLRDNVPLSVKVYDVTDLSDFDSVIELISNTIVQSSWDAVGGPGAMKGIDCGESAFLVISQTRRVHEEIEILLNDLRQMKRAKPKSGDAGATIPLKRAKSDAVIKIAPEESRIARSNNQFACDLYAKLGTKNENVVFSPLSITAALAMTYAGARKETAEEFTMVLHLASPQDSIPAEMFTLIKKLTANRNSPNQPQFTIANRLWCQRDHVFLEPFLQTCRESYGAEVGLVDFMKQPETARKTINEWIAEKTKKKIPELLGPSAINPDDQLRLILTNAIYFKGKWEKTFEKTATKAAPFYALDADAKRALSQVRLMHAVDAYRYTKADGVQILDLPYQGTDLAMTILLPAKGEEPFATLRSSLSAEKLDEWFAALKPHIVDLHLPAFTMTSDVPLSKLLNELGMHRAFDATNGKKPKT